ncbi:hypothetical protein [Pseudaestuariivita rosea]|uniref:hypothetical protein n=1 Tax=Pseudaestuariivita rosea TaxID=2763263 RepID=UPI001ABB2D7F|nr:hypothetical protein [Pseudaestuariivita rosea]
MRLIVFGILATALLAGCSRQAMMDRAYPDRMRFAFQSAHTEDILKYACERGETESETRRRATAAHRYFDSQMDAFAQRFAERMKQAVDNGENEVVAAVRLSRQSEDWAEQVVDLTEARYQCMFYDAVEPT